MLTATYLDQLPEPIVALFADAEEQILVDMARRIAKYDYFIPSAQWQQRKLEEAGVLRNEIIQYLSKATGKSQTELRKMMKEAATLAIQSDIDIYQEYNFDVPDISESQALRDVLNAGYEATFQTMVNLTRTTANTATQQFERALDMAWMKVSSGAFDYSTAVRSAVKDLATEGMRTVVYPSGHKDTIEVAVRRAVVTGVNQTSGRLQKTLADELGSDLMELTAHEGARNTGVGFQNHESWQGKIVSLSGKPGYLSLDDIGYGDVQGFQGANCRHSWNPWFDGMTRTWTEKKLQELSEKKYTYNGKELSEYEATQEQRYIERGIRRWKREKSAMEAAGQDSAEATAKLKAWNERMESFLSQTNFKRQYSREEIA